MKELFEKVNFEKKSAKGNYPKLPCGQRVNGVQPREMDKI